MNLNDFCSKDASELAELVHRKEILPHELVSDAIDQIEESNPALNAVVYKRYEAALKEASQVDSSLPFAGIPILLKDISQSVKGEVLTAGSKLLAKNIAKRDSHFVAALKKAGFIVVGSTNAPEFGLKNITEPKLHGPSRNPWNPAYSPGGSSGGAAASVASGMVPVAGASDGGGSIRIPASFTGLVGLKPTRGRMPVGPGVGRQWQGAAVDFALTKTVRDTAALLDQLQTIQPAAAFQVPLFQQGYTEYLTNQSTKTFRIGFSTKSPVGTPVSEEAVNTVHQVANFLQQQGHVVEQAQPNINGRALMEQYFLMNAGEMAGFVQTMEADLGKSLTHHDMEIESWVLAEAGKKVTAGEFSLSLAAWDQAAEQMAAFHEKYDLYLTPATAFDAPKIGELTPTQQQIDKLLGVSSLESSAQQTLIYDMFEPSLTYTPFTQLANLTGQPGISLPTGQSLNGLPLGVQLMAPKGNEHWLLTVAKELEQSPYWHQVTMIK
ncbi:amidase [Jeotgalibacillus marinus]|uniref:Amidase n=1 Tax=Jeotgalibacillus marinus TaxID=86667 RepID=A0ABV3Q5C0_9BACL